MFPVLFSIFKMPISSFGVFITLGFLFGIFLIWRLSRAWDLEEEKILDLTLLTFFGGLIGARLYFFLQHPSFFSSNFLKVLIIYKYPGFSFWGAILGGWLTLFFVSRAKKMDFAQVGDIASVGLLGSLIFADLGCFLGGCGAGIKSNLFFSTKMVGLVGNRFPTQLLEGLLFLVVLFGIWSTATHFHTRGKILSLSLVYIGLIKLIMEPFKQTHDEGFLLSLALFFLGITFLYKVTKRKPLDDLKTFFTFLGQLITNNQVRKLALLKVSKSWYNKKTALLWKLRNFKKSLRRMNVKFS
jgi:phosphatidylglycerol:prolipoprotein diacylglycerol transferase